MFRSTAPPASVHEAKLTLSEFANCLALTTENQASAVLLGWALATYWHEQFAAGLGVFPPLTICGPAAHNTAGRVLQVANGHPTMPVTKLQHRPKGSILWVAGQRGHVSVPRLTCLLVEGGYDGFMRLYLAHRPDMSAAQRAGLLLGDAVLAAATIRANKRELDQEMASNYDEAADHCSKLALRHGPQLAVALAAYKTCTQPITRPISDIFPGLNQRAISTSDNLTPREVAWTVILNLMDRGYLPENAIRIDRDTIVVENPDELTREVARYIGIGSHRPREYTNFVYNLSEMCGIRIGKGTSSRITLDRLPRSLRPRLYLMEDHQNLAPRE
jgi:hypothetical protein